MAALAPTAILSQACSSDNTTESVDNSLDDGVTDTGTTAAESTERGNWVSGGTDRITTSFPDDSLFDNSGECPVSLTQTTTEGPCYFEDSTGEDISEGLSGLPMQLCLRLVDDNCNALQGYGIAIHRAFILVTPVTVPMPVVSTKVSAPATKKQLVTAPGIEADLLPTTMGG